MQGLSIQRHALRLSPRGAEEEFWQQVLVGATAAAAGALALKAAGVADA
jgi:hypothetical protein